MGIVGKIVEKGRNMAKNSMNLNELGQFFDDRILFFQIRNLIRKLPPRPAITGEYVPLKILVWHSGYPLIILLVQSVCEQPFPVKI